jgi:hypothetical protein
MRFAVDHWIDEAGESTEVAQANAHLGFGEAHQTDQSWAQMKSAEDVMLNAAQNGVSNDPNEQGKLAFGIAMGVAAYAAPPFAALMAGLYALAQAIAPELYNIGLLTPPHCTQTGPKATIADWGQPEQTKAPGIPAVLWASVADQMTRQANCEAYIPSAMLYRSFAGIWNQAHDTTNSFAMAVVNYGGPVPGDHLPEAVPFFGMPWEPSLWRYTSMSPEQQQNMIYYQQQTGALVRVDFNTGPLLPGHGTMTAATPSAYRGALTSSIGPTGTLSAAPMPVGKVVVVGAVGLGVLALAKPALFRKALASLGLRL